MEALGLDAAFVRPTSPHALEFGGLWRLEVDPQGARVWQRSPNAPQTWRNVAAAALPGDAADQHHPMPYLPLGDRWSREVAAVFVIHALEACLVAALPEVETQTGEPVSAADHQAASQALEEHWIGRRGRLDQAGMVRQVKALQRWIRERFGVAFLRHVRAVRRGRGTGLGHVVQAWEHRATLAEVARARSAWLPLLNAIALPYWPAAGWRQPTGWLKHQATAVDLCTDRLCLPWELGLRWSQTELPTFDSLGGGTAWLARTADQAVEEVWGSACDVAAFARACQRWSEQPGWPMGALPPLVRTELQRLHTQLTQRLIELDPHWVDQAAVCWANRSMAAWRRGGRAGWTAVCKELTDQWDALVGALCARAAASDPLPPNMAQWPFPHPWVAHARERWLEGAWRGACSADHRARL